MNDTLLIEILIGCFIVGVFANSVSITTRSLSIRNKTEFIVSVCMTFALAAIITSSVT
jgi:hypothetical protein